MNLKKQRVKGYLNKNKVTKKEIKNTNVNGVWCIDDDIFSLLKIKHGREQAVKVVKLERERRRENKKFKLLYKTPKLKKEKAWPN